MTHPIRRWLAPLLLAALALTGLLLAGGCGGDGDDEARDTTTTEAEGDTDDATAEATEPDEPGATDAPGATEPGADDDPEGPDDPEATEPGDGPADGDGDTPSSSAPALPLTPTDPAWAAACEAASGVSVQAWALVSGGTADPVAIGAALTALLDALPPGVATEEAAYTRQLITAYATQGDVATLEGDFRDRIDGLLAAVDEGCGVGEGQVTVPPAALDQLENILFG